MDGLQNKHIVQNIMVSYVKMPSLIIYINSTIINRIYEHQNLLSLYFVSFLVGLRTYQHPGTNTDLALLYTVRC